jgi:hypothetical protein
VVSTVVIVSIINLNESAITDVLAPSDIICNSSTSGPQNLCVLGAPTSKPVGCSRPLTTPWLSQKVRISLASPSCLAGYEAMFAEESTAAPMHPCTHALTVHCAQHCCRVCLQQIKLLSPMRHPKQVQGHGLISTQCCAQTCQVAQVHLASAMGWQCTSHATCINGFVCRSSAHSVWHTPLGMLQII